MIYARFSSPHYKWAQPYLEVFYNIATDSQGNGLAGDNANDACPRHQQLARRTGSELVEGGGFELGVNGGDRIFANDSVSLSLTLLAFHILIKRDTNSNPMASPI